MGVDLIRRRLTIRGEVQGVGLREAVRAEAQRLHVAGWIANRDDGTVEAVLEGEPDDVNAVVAYCRLGPEGAAIDDIELHPEEPSGLEDFAIR